MLHIPVRPIGAILTVGNEVPYNYYYILRLRSHLKSSCLPNGLQGRFMLMAQASLMLLNEHKFSSYMVRRIFSMFLH
ncbi:hypothetical protein ccbrp13_36730 [Ktedonobacteria bacterium brp13]|nr:hypothetical protein ccbrp13_36730 [Ktedonobacteria bacterium brp13]